MLYVARPPTPPLAKLVEYVWAARAIRNELEALQRRHRLGETQWLADVDNDAPLFSLLCAPELKIVVREVCEVCERFFEQPLGRVDSTGWLGRCCLGDRGTR